MIRRILIVGGANGIGLSMAHELAGRESCERVYVVDKAAFNVQYAHPKIRHFQFDLREADYSLFDRFTDIDALMITAGYGRLSLFRDVTEHYIVDSFNVNTLPVLRLVRRFYGRLEGQDDFYCGVMDSIAGWMSSPFLAVYGATKAALKIFIESVNVELRKSGTKNVVLNVSPGFFNGSSFYGQETDIAVLRPLACEIIRRLEAKDDLFIPRYEEVYKEVLQRYHDDFRQEGTHSYDYKAQQVRTASRRTSV